MRLLEYSCGVQNRLSADTVQYLQRHVPPLDRGLDVGELPVDLLHGVPDRPLGELHHVLRVVAHLVHEAAEVVRCPPESLILLTPWVNILQKNIKEIRLKKSDCAMNVLSS